eukprot:7301788-Prymnesium_polylepis.1
MHACSGGGGTRFRVIRSILVIRFSSAAEAPLHNRIRTDNREATNEGEGNVGDDSLGERTELTGRPAGGRAAAPAAAA